MKKILFFFTIILVLSQVQTKSQNQEATLITNELPKTLKNIVPNKYKIINESYSKVFPIINIDFSMEILSKYGCSNNKDLWNTTSISVGIMIIEDANIAKMQEDMMPFANYLPTKDSHKPQIDIRDELTEYSGTTLIELSGGRGAYYTYTRKCIQDDKNETYGISLTSMFGSQAVKISVGIIGDIDATKATAILKEWHGILSKFNFQNL